MKRILLSCMTCSIIFVGIRAQECPLYYPDLKDAQLEYKQYDKKGGLTGSSKQVITDIKRTSGSVEISVAVESFDAKGKSLGSANLSARCEGGVYYIDMKNFLNQESMESYKDMEMTVTGGSLEMPSSMKAGDLLKSGDMKMSFSSGGMTVMNITINVSNRKVEAVENLTTPAGTFECYKISSDVAMKMMMNMKTKSVEWYSKGVGLVKSETYSTDGKLMGSNVLTALKK